MQSGPNQHEYHHGEARIASQQWMEENIPIVGRKWEPADELDPEMHGKGLSGFKGVMYRGKWLISPERQERTVKIFWVSGCGGDAVGITWAQHSLTRPSDFY